MFMFTTEVQLLAHHLTQELLPLAGTILPHQGSYHLGHVSSYTASLAFYLRLLSETAPSFSFHPPFFCRSRESGAFNVPGTLSSHPCPVAPAAAATPAFPDQHLLTRTSKYSTPHLGPCSGIHSLVPVAGRSPSLESQRPSFTFRMPLSFSSAQLKGAVLTFLSNPLLPTWCRLNH